MSNTPQSISAQDALNAINAGDAILIDVREPSEFSAEHIAQACSIPLSAIDTTLKTSPLPTNKKIIFQCHKGKRGENACITAQNCGIYDNPIYNLEGGISAWKEAGLPVVGQPSTAAKLPLFRQVQIIVGALVFLCTLIGFGGIKAGFLLAGVLGGALFFAGLTGWCGLAMLLSTMPWNK